MSETDERYELIMEPDDTWMIWDRDSDSPADFRGRLLLGLDRRSADSFRAVLLEMGSSMAKAS